jgi:hypothetical protein
MKTSSVLPSSAHRPLHVVTRRIATTIDCASYRMYLVRLHGLTWPDGDIRDMLAYGVLVSTLPPILCSAFLTDHKASASLRP